MATSRPRIWVPIFEGTFYNTARSMAIKHVWRVRPMLDIEDLIQEAALVFYRCADKYYPERCSTPKHFMSLFTISFLNRITTLANDRFKYREQCAASQFGDEAHEMIASTEAPSSPTDEAELRLLIEMAPPRIQRLLLELQTLGRLEPLRMYNEEDRRTERQKRQELKQWATEYLAPS